MGRASRMKKERKLEKKTIRLWHYTTDQHLAKITRSGVIKPTSILIGENEKPAAWVSTNSDWERTGSKRVDLGDGQVSEPLQRDDMPKYNLTPIRIEIDASKVKAVDWKTFKRVSGIPYEAAKWLEKAGLDEGANPDEWYAVFESVTVDKWISIDLWNGVEWIPYMLGEKNG